MDAAAGSIVTIEPTPSATSTSASLELTPRDRAVGLLTEPERGAYDRQVEGAQPPISLDKAAQFFALYLHGHSCDEIRRLNPDFKFGQIVQARVDYLWDEQRADHIVRLLAGVRERVQQIQLESVEYLANMLAAHHKKNGDKIKKYLQTGDEKELGDLVISLSSLKEYAKIVDTLLKITGQDRQSKVSGEVTVKHESTDVIPSGFDPKKPLSGVQAAKLLALEVQTKPEF